MNKDTQNSTLLYNKKIIDRAKKRREEYIKTLKEEYKTGELIDKYKSCDIVDKLFRQAKEDVKLTQIIAKKAKLKKEIKLTEIIDDYLENDDDIKSLIEKISTI